MIIKCPECGRQVSDKAPSCPTCGVQIAGKIVRCTQCGEVYFKEDGMCPNCHHPNNTATQSAPVQPTVAAPIRPNQTGGDATSQSGAQPKAMKRPDANGGNDKQQSETPQQPKKNNTATFVVAFIFAAIVCGVLFYFYQNAQSEKEAEEYEFAMRSTDPEILQSYLLKFGDAPQEHRDSIEAHLQRIQKGDQDWQNAVLSNSVSALKAYLNENPETVHRQEALNKIDSLEWLSAQKSSDQNAIEEYIHNHPDGRYIDEANVLLSQLKSTMVQPNEKEMITSTFRQFFQSINSKDETRLVSTVSMVLDSFLGKSNATGDDVLSFMYRLYKDGVSNLNWHIDSSSYQISKQEIAENEYEYTVTFTAREDVENGNGQNSRIFKVKAKVTNDGKIADFNLSEIK